MFLLMSQLLNQNQNQKQNSFIVPQTGHVFAQQLKKQQWEINRIIKKVRMLKALKHLIYFGSTFIKLTRSQ